MRKMEFKMERTGLLEVGDILPVTEGKLPNSYYYTLGRAYAMSANYKYNERLQSREGKVIDVKETEKGYSVLFKNKVVQVWISHLFSDYVCDHAVEHLARL